MPQYQDPKNKPAPTPPMERSDDSTGKRHDTDLSKANFPKMPASEKLREIAKRGPSTPSPTKTSAREDLGKLAKKAEVPATPSKTPVPQDRAPPSPQRADPEMGR